MASSVVPKVEGGKNGNEEDYPKLSAAFVGSFAYQTIKDRLPVILTKVVDLLFRERNHIRATYGQDASEDTKKVIGILSRLKNEIQTNKPFVLLTSNFPDVPAWNAAYDAYVEEHGREPAWFEASFLYVECYMYRRIFEAFQLSSTLQSFDPFQAQKETAFVTSLEAMKFLGHHLHHTVKVLQMPGTYEELVKREFMKLIQVCLWGNRCDLSISAGQNVSLNSDPLQLLEDLEPNIVVNDLDLLWTAILEAKKRKDGEVCLDVVLDNAGYELFCDLCLAEFLQELGLSSRVRWYVKVMPWYVSDTMQKDVEWTLASLSTCPSDELLREYGCRWKERFETKAWTFEKDTFWTLPNDYSEMKTVDPELYDKLRQADLIIFKGDLNYRKLIGDKRWPFMTPFRVAVRGFEPAFLCALRTIKCDCLAGTNAMQIEKLGVDNVDWMLAGEYAVIQCLTPS